MAPPHMTVEDDEHGLEVLCLAWHPSGKMFVAGFQGGFMVIHIHITILHTYIC